MSLLSSGQSDERIPASTVDDLLSAVCVGLDRLEVELQHLEKALAAARAPAPVAASHRTADSTVRSEGDAARADRAGGVDLVLTAVSAVLVLAILTILLLWIG